MKRKIELVRDSTGQLKPEGGSNAEVMKLLESKLDESQTTARALTAFALGVFEDTEKHLAAGRPKGTRTRQQNADDKRKLIEQAVTAFFSPRSDGSAPPGFLKTNKEITNNIQSSVNCRLTPPYSASSLEKMVKEVAARERAKAKKSLQA